MNVFEPSTGQKRLNLIVTLMVIGFAGAALFSAVSRTLADSVDGNGATMLKHSSKQTIQVFNGNSLYVECQGDKSQPALVFLSGLGGSADSSWPAKVVDPLQRAQRICFVDRAGTGHAPDRTANTANGPVTNSEEVSDALDKAGQPGPYVFAGWSYGALVGLLAAVETYSTNPDELEGVILIDPVLPNDYATVDTQGWVEGRQKLQMVQTQDMIHARGDGSETVKLLGDTPVFIVLSDSRVRSDKDAGGNAVKEASEVGALSTDWTVATIDTTHFIGADSPATVTDATVQVLKAISSHAPLPPCPELASAVCVADNDPSALVG